MDRYFDFLKKRENLREQAETFFKSIDDIIDNNAECPLDVSIIPNNMGINLSAVDKISWQKMADGQLSNLSIYFKTPDNNISESIICEFKAELEELKEKYPNMIYTLNKKNGGYFVRADIKTQGGKEEYLGALKGYVPYEHAIQFLKDISKTEYDKYY